MFADRLPVTDQGVMVPKIFLGDATEVAIRQENGHIVLEPVVHTTLDKAALPVPDPDDPIWNWGSDPVDIQVTDASVNLDKYLYGSDM